MKTAILSILAFSAILSISSCSKSSNGPASNTWSYSGTSYTALSTSYMSGTQQLYATNLTTNNINTYSDIYVTFPNGQPTASGKYQVVSPSFPTGANPVWIEFDNGTTNNSYVTTGGNGTQSVSVNISPAGKISVSGSNITLENRTNLADSSSTFSLNITQQ
jgi:hypothetical protein